MPGLAKDPQTGDGIQALPFSDTIQNVSIASTANASGAFGANVTLLRLCADVACFYLVGADPTATTSNGQRLPAGTLDHVRVLAGQKISVIRESSDGTLNICEIAIGT